MGSYMRSPSVLDAKDSYEPCMTSYAKTLGHILIGQFLCSCRIDASSRSIKLSVKGNSI